MGSSIIHCKVENKTSFEARAWLSLDFKPRIFTGVIAWYLIVQPTFSSGFCIRIERVLDRRTIFFVYICSHLKTAFLLLLESCIAFRSIIIFIIKEIEKKLSPFCNFHNIYGQWVVMISTGGGGGGRDTVERGSGARGLGGSVLCENEENFWRLSPLPISVYYMMNS